MLSNQYLFILFIAAAISVPVYSQCEVQLLDGPNPEGDEHFGRPLALENSYSAVGNLGIPVTETEGSAHIYRLVNSIYQRHDILSSGVVDCQNIYTANDVVIHDDVLVTSDAGSCPPTVYIYRLDDGKYQLEQEISEVNGQSLFGFGGSVSAFDDVLVASSTGPKGDQVHIFRFNGAEWIFEASLTQPDGGDSDAFGSSVAVSQDLILVGNFGEDFPMQNTGAVYVYRFTDGKWALEDKLLPTGMASQWFGIDVALDEAGDTALIGASHDSADYGSAYIFEYNGTEWTLMQKLQPNADDFAFFGQAVDISDDGNNVLIGAPDKVSFNIHSGAAYFFHRSDNQWQPGLKFVTPGTICLGASVALDGDRALVGDPCGQAGEVYVFAGVQSIDCNNNGTPDGCDIAVGTSLDSNHNFIPDECDPSPDLNGDGQVNGNDLGLLLGEWKSEKSAVADLNNDGIVDGSDLGLLLGAWGELNAPADCSRGVEGCCSPHGSPGCNDDECCQSVCGIDPFCCGTAWDTVCVNEAQELCGCSPPASCSNPDAGGCCLPGPSGNGSPGCDDAICCETICDLVDPFCCDVMWDESCAGWAFQFCACPPIQCTPDAGDCCASNGSPGCEDLDCCATICGIDSFCCQVVWDALCADQAEVDCGICKD